MADRAKYKSPVVSNPKDFPEGRAFVILKQRNYKSGWGDGHTVPAWEMFVFTNEEEYRAQVATDCANGVPREHLFLSATRLSPHVKVDVDLGG